MLRRLNLQESLACLRKGGVIAFPTDTSFGLGCRAYDAQAVSRIVSAKGRPSGKPLPILLPSIDYLRVRSIETPLICLAEAFWPGPLTLVVPAFPGLPAQVTAGTNMVGVRISPHPLARALVEALGEPLIATSANRSGEPAARSIEAAENMTLIDVDGVLWEEGAPAPQGSDALSAGSTVVGLSNGDLQIHRQGPISEAELRRVWDANR